MNRFVRATIALAALCAAAGAQAATQPGAETPPPLPAKDTVKAEQIANAVRKYLNGDQISNNKPIQVGVFAIVTSDDGDACGVIRLDATTPSAFSAAPATIRLETAESRLAEHEQKRGCMLYSEVEDPKSLLDGPGVRAVTPTEELTDPKRIAELFEATATAAFQDAAASGSIRRLLIAFGFTNTKPLELSDQTMMLIGLYQEPGKAPEFDFLKRITFIDEERSMAAPVRVAYVGSNQTGWADYQIISPNKVGGQRNMTVIYQYFVSGMKQLTPYTGLCQESTVQDAKDHFLSHDGFKICRCDVKPANKKKCLDDN